ncbi:MAG: hypothetical protein SFV23_08890 [Planctomycetaceae bacterium]|nr:hypothetical protein [Planctomycetaceae bacterium]
MTQIELAQQAFHRGTAALFALLTPEQMRRLAELPGDQELQSRMEELASKANEGELSDSDRAEYEAYVEANDLLTILQAEARYRLADCGK